MKNKQRGKRGLKRLAISMLVCVAMLTSLITPTDALANTSGVDDVVQLCDHIHGSEAYSDSEFEHEADYGEDYTANEPSYDNDENGEVDYGYEENDDYKDEDEYESEKEEELHALNIPIVPIGIIIGPGTVASGDTATVSADIVGNILVDGGMLYLDGNFTITGMVTVQNGGTFTMSNGLITGSGTRGVTVTGASTFNMTGGLISGNTADLGGGVHVDGTFTMSGGTISGNTASSGGGGVFVQNGTFTMTDDSLIEQNHTGADGGGGVHIHSNGTFTMTGNAVIRNNIATGNFGGGVMIYGGTVTMTGDAIIEGNTSSDGAGVAVFGTFYMHGNAIIRGNEANVGGGVNLNTSAKFFMSGNAVIEGNTASSLGGGVVNMAGLFVMSDNAMLRGNNAGSGGGFMQFYEPGMSFTMNDNAAIIENTAVNGGGVWNQGIFTMNNGRIEDNIASGIIGGVHNSRTFTMYNGTISNNTTAGHGGGVNNQGTFTMSGGTLAGNEAGTNGGGVSNTAAGTFTMTGSAMITGNAASNGGGVNTSGTLTMSGDAEISDNTASSNGGGVRNSNTFGMSGNAEIFGNTANSTGGGVHNWDGGTFTMTGGANIRDNAASSGGGVNNLATFEMSGNALIGENTATNNGGGVRNNGNFTMHDGEITGNTATNHGGGVYLLSSSGTTFEMTGGTIAGNTAQHGGGAWIPVALRDNQARVSILEPALFSGNLALAGAFDYGLDDGIDNYPNIRWQGYATGQNSILGSHLLNNFDINNNTQTPDSHVVTFVGNGGTVYNAPQHSFTVADGTVLSTGQIPAIPNVARTGYTFLGWSEAAASGSPLVTDWSFTITQNRTFYAQWTPTGGNNPGGRPPGGGGGTTVIQDEDVPLAEIVSHFAYLIGYEDGTVRPRNNITRAEVSTIFFRFMSDSDRASRWTQMNPYSDVALQQWFNNAVSTTTNADMFIGFPDGTFRPNSAITRAELAAVIARMMGVTDSGSPLFNDIDGHWAQAYINAAAQNGWAVGYEGLGGRFLPNQPITRAEAAAMINRVFGRLPEDSEDLLPGMLTWPDNANPNAWYYLYIQEATNSHTYVMKANGINETWEELIQPRPWVLLERPDSRPEDIFRIQN